ncbi:hypothetical protein [Paludisphaera sp.]|uniref:hypothetical protein n=1 Tax=Paludisphaera sp. TaxID=2017432 RepID=UPI00301D2230
MTCYVIKRGKGRAFRDAYGEVFQPDDEAPIFLCGDLGPRCSCGCVTEILCDFPVGKGMTCDKRLCGHCSHLIGPDLQYCKAHHAEWRAFRESGGLVRELENVEPFKGR